MTARLTVAAAREEALSPLKWAVYGLGFMVTVVVVMFIARTAQKAFEK